MEQFPARPTLLKLKVLTFQQAILQLIWSPFGHSTSPKTEGAHYRARSSEGQKRELFGYPI